MSCEYGISKHLRLVGRILEVAVPAGAELWARPAVHLVELLLGWSNSMNKISNEHVMGTTPRSIILNASLDSVGCKGTGAVDLMDVCD